MIDCPVCLDKLSPEQQQVVVNLGEAYCDCQPPPNGGGMLVDDEVITYDDLISDEFKAITELLG